VFDRLLQKLVSRSFRRGFGGEPIWIAVGAAAWLVVRSRKQQRPVVWSGALREGESLVISNLGGDSPGVEQSG
jgi:hypothetical protein